MSTPKKNRHGVTLWRRGDVVRLRSGGPRMTVCSDYVGSDPSDISAYSVNVRWFSDDLMCETVVDSESLSPVRVRP